MTMAELDLEYKQRIDRIMALTKEDIATQWVTLGTDMKEKYDKLKMEFIEYKIANDISRFFEVVRSEKSDEILGSKIRSAIEGNTLYIDWLKKQESKAKLAKKKFAVKS